MLLDHGALDFFFFFLSWLYVAAPLRFSEVNLPKFCVKSETWISPSLLHFIALWSQSNHFAALRLLLYDIVMLHFDDLLMKKVFVGMSM